MRVSVCCEKGPRRPQVQEGAVLPRGHGFGLSFRLGALHVLHGLALLFLVGALALFAPQPGMAKEITIGVRAHLGKEDALARWQATADAISERLGDHEVRLIPYSDPEAIVNGARRGEFDFAITDPSTYVRMEVDAGATAMLSLVNKWEDEALIRFGSVIFTLRTRHDFVSLEELRGKSLMAVAPNAFGGWQMVQEEFLKRNIVPEDFLGELTFSGGNQVAVVEAVRDGRVDAGVVRTGVLEKLAAQGVIKLDHFRIIEAHRFPGFPLEVSTDLYPEWVFAKIPGLPEQLGDVPVLPKRIIDDVRQALLDITPESPAAQQGGYVGWQEPLSYLPVRSLLQHLEAPPYEGYSARMVRAALWESRYWILAVFIAVAGLILALASAARRRAELSKIRGQIIQRQQGELNFRQRALDEHAIVSITDAKGKIIYANDKFVEISGYSREELLGQDHRILNSGVHDADFFRDMWQTIYRGETWTGEIRNRRKDGSFYWVQSTIVPQMGKNGRPVKFISIRTDITRSKEQQAKSQLTEFFELVNDEVYLFSVATDKCFYANRKALEAVCGEGGAQDGACFPDLGRALGVCETTYRENLQALIEGKLDRLSYEIGRTLADGSNVPALVQVQFLKSEWLEPCFFITVTDISERREAENEVAELKVTLDLIDDEVYMFWPDTKKFFYANRAAQERLGLSEKEIFDMTPVDLEGGLTLEECEQVLRPMMQERAGSVSFVRRSEDEDGRMKATEYDIKFVWPAGHKPRFIATLRDVTDRVRAQEEIRQLSSSLDLIKNEVYVFWPETYEFIYLNNQALARTGWGEEGWRGKHTFDYITDAEQAKLEKNCAALMRGPKKSMVFETVDSKGVPLEIYMHLIEPEGEKPRFLSVYRDISDRKKAEKAKAEFIATVSHELRTPLTSIKGALGLMRAGVLTNDPHKTQKMLDIAYSNTKRLTALVNDILDWEKIEAGKMTYRMEESDLSRLLRDAVEANRGYAEEHGVSFELAEPLAPMPCKVDRGRMMQVMANLLSNAAKFSHEGGKVEISARVEGRSIRVDVCDHGVGIPAEAQPRIFERFTQADSSDVRLKGGTGLGLSITRAIVEAHGGVLDFVSREGEGTTFFFTVPAQNAEADSRPDHAQGRQLSGRRILVVEDDRDIARLLSVILEEEGCGVRVARTAGEARDMLAAETFDGMTLDLGLPDQSGISLLQELRSREETASLPVVVVSANAEQGRNSLRGDAFGVVDWLQKPIEEGLLVRRLKEAVGQKAGRGREILLVGHDEKFRRFVDGAIDDSCTVTHVNSLAGARESLARRPFDLVILDLTLPDGSGVELLPLLNRPPQDSTPVVVISGQEISADIPERLRKALAGSETEKGNERLIRTIGSAIRAHGETDAA